MNPLEQLTEISNDFEIHYQRFRDANVTTWAVTVKNQQPNLKGRGDTLEDAIADMYAQKDMREFATQLDHAKIKSGTVDELKANIKAIL